MTTNSPEDLKVEWRLKHSPTKHSPTNSPQVGIGIIAAGTVVGMGVILVFFAFTASRSETNAFYLVLGSFAIHIGITAIVFLWINTFFKNVLALLQRIAERLDNHESK